MSIEGQFVAAAGSWLQVDDGFPRLDGADILRTTAGVTLAAEDAWPPQLVEVASEPVEPSSDPLVVNKDRQIVDIDGAQTLRVLEIGYPARDPGANGRLLPLISVLFTTEADQCYDAWVGSLPVAVSDAPVALVRDGWMPDPGEYSLYEDDLFDLGAFVVATDERADGPSSCIAMVSRDRMSLVTMSDQVLRRWTRQEPSGDGEHGRLLDLVVYSAHFEREDVGIYICVLDETAGFSYLRLEADGTSVWARHYTHFASKGAAETTDSDG